MGQNVRALFLKLWRHFPLVCFVLAILCLCFVYGVVVGKWHYFPYRLLNMGWDSLVNWKAIKGLRSKSPDHIYPARYEGEGVVVYDPEHVYPGMTLVTAPWKDGDDWNLGIRLVDLNGNILHEWRCNPEDIWEESPYDDYAAGSKDNKTKTYVHGALLLTGGDVVFNLEYFSLVRLNAQSKVIWKLPYRTHHSIFKDDDGNFWVCGGKWRKKQNVEFVGLRPPFFEEMILKVSPDGAIERELSVFKIMYRSGYHSMLFFNGFSNTGDVLHLNDVEILSERDADAFDFFEAGDIMISLKHINTIFIIDGKTERIKWSLTHPFIAQHDPDFTEDGCITVFDNHTNKDTSESKFGGSRILLIEPSTKEVTVLYGHEGDQYFFTSAGGKHQHLPNGNILITEARAGRVFEITPNARVVWSWIASRWDKNSVPEVLEGTRYGLDFASFTNKFKKDKK